MSAPAEYAPAAGPCAGLGCRARIRRYGPGAVTLCPACTAGLARNRKTASTLPTKD